MFNSTVWDVFIGLILVFLLYSLLVTILGEIICNWIGLRARILRVSIEKMLNDGYYKRINETKYSGLWYRVQRFFLKEFPDFKNSFAGKFYKYPTIKYLSVKAGEQTTAISQTKPSYLSDEVFADSLIQLIKEKGMGVDDMEKVNFSLLYNTHHIQPATLKNLRNMADGADLPLFKDRLKIWFNETQDRATGWYKSKLQLILFWLGFVVTVIFNVDSIKIARLLSKDKDARNQLVAMGIALAKDSARYKDFTGAGNSSIHTQTVLDTGYARVSKDLHDANLVLGLGWNMDTLLTPLKISLSDKANANAFNKIFKELPKLQHYENALETGKRNSAINNIIIDSCKDKLQLLTARYYSESDTLAVKAQLLQAHRDLQAGIEMKKRDSLLIQIAGKNLHDLHRMVNSAVEDSFAVIDKVTSIDKDNKKSIVISGSRKLDWWEKTCHFFATIFWFSLPGFFITGLMLSLGAPFWFDMLKKVVSIRSEGVKPEEKPVKNKVIAEAPAEPAILIPANAILAPANAEEALNDFTRKTLQDAGIVSIAIEYTPDTHTPFLMMSTANAEIKQLLQQKYGNAETYANGFTIQVKYSVDEEIIVSMAMSGSEIANETGKLGAGTLGANIRKKESDHIYFISCWHVMKDDINWNIAPLEKTIMCNGQPLGEVEEGFLAHDSATGIDIGIARYLKNADAGSNENFKIKQQPRTVTAFDSLVSSPVKVFGKVCKLKDATIFHDKINARIRYPDGTIHQINDVFSMVTRDETGRKVAPTSGGDSGALVLDEKGAPIGMIVGGNGNFSYAMKFSNVFGKDKPFKEYFFNV